MQLFLENALIDAPFWDICCDHGHVGIGALEKKISSEVHFVDQLPHIFERLDQLIRQTLPDQNNYRYYLHPMKGEQIDFTVEGTCLIAGVGGLTIKKILEALFVADKLKAQRLLLSPHTDIQVMLEFIESADFANQYTLVEKFSLKERKKIRSLYILDKKENPRSSD